MNIKIIVLINMFTLSVFSQECLQGRPEKIGQGLPNLKEEVCYIDGSTLYIEGKFGSVSLEALKNNGITNLVLNSPGGSTGTAIAAAKYIRAHRIQTLVPDGAYCASSCTLIFQAGVLRQAYKTSKFIYHCVGVGRFGTMIFTQECGSDLSKLTPKCQKDLDDFIESSIIGTEKHFENYKTYNALDLFSVLMSQPDLPEWFETGNFCKKHMTLNSMQTMEFNVVQEIVD
jgi:hypothetical protein